MTNKKKKIVCPHGSNCFAFKRMKNGRGSKHDISHCKLSDHTFDKKMSLAVERCHGCNGDCEFRVCRNGSACSRHKRVVAYHKNKKNEVSVEDMEHEKKFIHRECVHCGDLCCGRNCGMLYGSGIPPCSTYDNYDDDDY